MRKRIRDLFTELRTQKMYHARTLCTKERARVGEKFWNNIRKFQPSRAELRMKLAPRAAPERNRALGLPALNLPLVHFYSISGRSLIFAAGSFLFLAFTSRKTDRVREKERERRGEGGKSASNDGTYITNHRRPALHCTSREIFHIRRILSLHIVRYHRRRNNIINPAALRAEEFSALSLSLSLGILSAGISSPPPPAPKITAVSVTVVAFVNLYRHTYLSPRRD